MFSTKTNSPSNSGKHHNIRISDFCKLWGQQMISALWWSKLCIVACMEKRDIPPKYSCVLFFCRTLASYPLIGAVALGLLLQSTLSHGKVREQHSTLATDMVLQVCLVHHCFPLYRWFLLWRALTSPVPHHHQCGETGHHGVLAPESVEGVSGFSKENVCKSFRMLQFSHMTAFFLCCCQKWLCPRRDQHSRETLPILLPPGNYPWARSLISSFQGIVSIWKWGYNAWFSYSILDVSAVMSFRDSRFQGTAVPGAADPWSQLDSLITRYIIILRTAILGLDEVRLNLWT